MAESKTTSTTKTKAKTTRANQRKQPKPLKTQRLTLDLSYPKVKESFMIWLMRLIKSILQSL